MKNLKKLISVVLCVAMLASFMVVGTSAATYGDVDESKSYYTDVELLSSLDILKGDENGNFNPDAEIKRSEFAAVVCRALGAESAATSKSVAFTDVAPNHWAIGYIAWAAGKGIVNGYGDGTFMPDKAVSYQEAIKMMTAAMGYGPAAEAGQGYPWGYITEAGTYGVTTGISAEYTAPATRATVAQLVANALDAPLMDQKDTIYGKLNVVYNGKTSECDGEERTLLNHYLDVIKVKANVAQNYKTDDSLWRKNREPQVKLDLLKVMNASDKEDYVEDLYVYSDGANKLRTGVKVFVGDTDASSYLGYDVNAYLFFNEDEALELKAIIPDAKSAETLEVTKDIVKAEVSSKTITFEYWEDIENDQRTTDVDVATDAAVYVNGSYIGELNKNDAADDAFEAATEANSVLFMGPRGEYFNKVFITEYVYDVVEAVDLEELAIECNDTYIDLDKESRGNDNFVYTIIKDGVEIGIEDLAENDVLSIVAPGGELEKAAYLDIYVSSKTLTGKVTGSKNENTYYIDKVEYKTVDGVKLNLGDEGTFRLTTDGKILDFDVTTSLSDNYAYILKVYADEVYEDEFVYQVRLFTKEGKTVSYDIASSVKVTSEVKGEVKTETLKNSTGAQADLYDDMKALLEAADEETAKDNASKRLITYSLSNDEINKISFAAASGEAGKDFNVANTDGTYKATTSKFGKYYFNDATSLFYAPVTGTDGKEDWAVDADDVSLLSFASLDEDASYTAYGYAIDDRTMGAALVVNSLGFAGKASALAVVESVSDGLNAENEVVDMITVYQSGKTATYAIDEDVDTLDSVKAGDIIQIVLNGAGEISQAAVVYDGALTDHAKAVNKDDSDISFVVGYAVDKANGALYINDEVKEGGADYAFNFDANSTFALVDDDKEGYAGFISGLSSTASVKYTKFNKSGEATNDTYKVVVKLVEDEIVDIVEYVNPAK